MFERWKWWRGCRSIWNRTGWRRNDATGAGRLPFTWPPGPGTPPLSPYSSHTALTSPPRSAPSSSFHYAYPPFSFHSPSILLPFSFHSPAILLPFSFHSLSILLLLTILALILKDAFTTPTHYICISFAFHSTQFHSIEYQSGCHNPGNMKPCI